MARQTLPHALEAEASILGAALVRNEVLLDLPQLELEDFYDARHQAVWAVIRNLEAAQRPIDVVTVGAELDRAGRLEAIGGVAFLGELTLRVPTADNVVAYAEIVREKRVARRLMLVASEILAKGYEEGLDIAQYLADAQGAISSLERPRPEQTFTIGELAHRRLDDVERFAREQAAGGRALSGAPTGVASLDEKTGGWQFEIVNLLAARPGMGKSSLALATADACSLTDHGVHVFSLEDSWHAYTDRQLARLSGVPAIQIRRADFRGEQVGALYKAMADLKSRKGWIVDTRGGLTALELVRAMRRRQDANRTRVGICDYIQLLRPRDPRMREHEHLGDCMQTFAESAKVDGIAWLVLSQFNRELEKRNDKRPQLSDLRGSGELEEKCKLAVALYRGSHYGGRPKREIDYECDCPEAVRSCAHAPKLDEWERQVQVLVLKGGNGPTGRVLASWDGPTTRMW